MKLELQLIFKLSYNKKLSKTDLFISNFYTILIIISLLYFLFDIIWITQYFVILYEYNNTL